MPTPSQSNEILRQLNTLTKDVGKLLEAVARQEEYQREHEQDTVSYRARQDQYITNLQTRAGNLEQAVRSIDQALEKTLLPLARRTSDDFAQRAAWRNRVIGFTAAWTMLISIVVSTITLNWGNVMKIFTRLGSGDL